MRSAGCLRRGWPWLLGLAFGLFLVACRGNEPAPTPTSAAPPTPTLTPADILSRAADAMTGLQSAAFDISRKGGPAYMDQAQTLNFASAVGDYQAPNAIDARLTVQSNDVTLEIRTIAVGQEQWITNPLNQRWEQLPPDWGFNPAILFDPALGWQPLLKQDISQVRLLETTSFGGRSRYRLQATAAGDRVLALLGGVAGRDAVPVEFFVDVASFHIVQMKFSTASAAGAPSDWLLQFSDFDKAVDITPPANP